MSLDDVWHEDRRCPQWCVTGADHLTIQLKRGMDGYWHRGADIESPTADVDHNWHPIPVVLQFVQKEQVDERGHHRYPVEINLGDHTLSTDHARELAQRLLRLADEADGFPRDAEVDEAEEN